MTSFFKPLALIGGVLLAFAVSLAVAQTPGAERRGSPMYDLKSETTIKGTVESVENITAPSARGRRGLGGTHLLVKTGTQALEVHVGPTAYLAEQKIAIAKGDAVEIRGSRVTIDEESVLLARQIKKGEAVFTLRDASRAPTMERPSKVTITMARHCRRTGTRTMSPLQGWCHPGQGL